MPKLLSLIALTLTFALAATSPLHAQTLQTGTWTGTAVGPDGSSEDVTFKVEQKPVWTADGTPPVWSPDGTRVVFSQRGAAGSQLKITYYPPRRRIPLRNIQLDGDSLSYEFTAGGLDVTCSLTLQEDGSYSGPCGVGAGQGGRHTMRPPTD